MLSSHIVGSFHTSLSSFSTLFPLLGSLASGPASIVMLGALLFGRTLLVGSSMTMGIPTFFATLNWSADTCKKNFYQAVLQVILPLICIALFIVHPIGNQAWVYSMYWLIPVTLFTLQRLGYHSIFFTALNSTFIAHALGSIIWLYVANLEAATWIALIPRVAVERFVFALVNTVGYCVIQKVSTLLTHVSRMKQTNLDNQL